MLGVVFARCAVRDAFRAYSILPPTERDADARRRTTRVTEARGSIRCPRRSTGASDARTGRRFQRYSLAYASSTARMTRPAIRGRTIKSTVPRSWRQRERARFARRSNADCGSAGTKRRRSGMGQDREPSSATSWSGSEPGREMRRQQQSICPAQQDRQYSAAADQNSSVTRTERARSIRDRRKPRPEPGRCPRPPQEQPAPQPQQQQRQRRGGRTGQPPDQRQPQPNQNPEGTRQSSRPDQDQGQVRSERGSPRPRSRRLTGLRNTGAKSLPADRPVRGSCVYSLAGGESWPGEEGLYPLRHGWLAIRSSGMNSSGMLARAFADNVQPGGCRLLAMVERSSHREGTHASRQDVTEASSSHDGSSSRR